MNYLVDDEYLEIKYTPGNGDWTYHIEIPDTQELYVRWRYTKVSGYIDDYEIKLKPLFSKTGENKIISINSEIREYLHKGAGHKVRVTLYLDF